MKDKKEIKIFLRIIIRLEECFDAGLYQALGRRCIEKAYKKISFHYRLVKYLKKRVGKSETEKAPVFAEFLQIIWVLLSIILLFIAKFIAILSDKDFHFWPLKIILILLLYRLFEILLFAIYWVFLEREVYSHRRSLIGFLINLLEVSLIYSFAFVVFGCHQSILGSFWFSMMNILTIGFIGPESAYWLCKVLLITELMIADFIILTVIANLAGVIKKDQIG